MTIYVISAVLRSVDLIRVDRNSMRMFWTFTLHKGSLLIPFQHIQLKSSIDIRDVEMLKQFEQT